MKRIIILVVMLLAVSGLALGQGAVIANINGIKVDAFTPTGGHLLLEGGRIIKGSLNTGATFASGGALSFYLCDPKFNAVGNLSNTQMEWTMNTEADGTHVYTLEAKVYMLTSENRYMNRNITVKVNTGRGFFDGKAKSAIAYMSTPDPVVPPPRRIYPSN